MILGISPDAPEKLAKFREKHDLGFILLSDPDHATAEAYGVPEVMERHRHRFEVNNDYRESLEEAGLIESFGRRLRSSGVLSSRTGGWNRPIRKTMRHQSHQPGQ